jgi:hypothetical protein
VPYIGAVRCRSVAASNRVGTNTYDLIVARGRYFPFDTRDLKEAKALLEELAVPIGNRPTRLLKFSQVDI